ncbi:hypothetical protein GYN07_13000 [Rhizobium leguminosarum bv. viciae 248]|uniref:hypothetical protein n=1 Tax=Rhizobium leguminosarum TaxID=384 RepID=UPI000368C1D3|nr:hypothetical protein [Rhizobium leguminosarum]QHW25199.1 hypothetical protein GYN07_13000 [Rhizobium leguminosarum bv. viciae 248]
MANIVRISLLAFALVTAFFWGEHSSGPYRPNYAFAEPNYLNFYLWSNGEGKFKFRDILKGSAYKFDRVCVSGEGGVPPYEVREGKAKLISGVELDDALSMSYVSVYLVGAGSYSVMNFDPLDFEIEWPFSDCQSLDGMSLDISTKSGITGKIATFKIGYEN